MQKSTIATIIFVVALLTAIWYALTAWYWPYYVNMVFAAPAGLLSFVLWLIGRRMDTGKYRYNIIGWILLLGTVVSLGVLAFFTLGR